MKQWYSIEEGIKKYQKIEILEGSYHVFFLCPQDGPENAREGKSLRVL